MDMEERLDSALAQAGGYKPYHLAIFLSVSLSCFIPYCYQGLLIVFVGYIPPHHCKLPDNSSQNESIPYTLDDQGNQVWDKCLMYVNGSEDNTTVPCTNGWTYYSDGYTSIVTEWDLVCKKDYLPDMVQSIYQFCCLTAEIMVPWCIDRYGRRSTHMYPAIMIAVTGTAQAFAPNLATFMALRGITGVFVVSCTAAGTTMLMEMFDSTKRPFAGLGLETGWVLAFLPMALFAWCLNNWRYLQFSLSVINIVWIVYYWFLHESVPWLAVTGQVKAANKVLNKTARWNRVKLKQPLDLTQDIQYTEMVKLSSADGTLEEDIQPKPHDLQDTEKASTISLKDALQLFQNPVLRKHLLVSMVLWFANMLVFYEIMYVTPILPGDRFFNFFIMVLVEIPAYITSFYAVKRYGRRIPCCVLHILAGLPLFVVVFIPEETAGGTDLSAVNISLVVVAKFCISASFAIMILFTKELFPTCFRATATGLQCVVGRLAGMSVPFIVYIGRGQLYWFPSITSAVVSTVVGLVLLILPDTSNKPLPQTTQDVVNWYKHHRFGDETIPNITVNCEEHS